MLDEINSILKQHNVLGKQKISWTKLLQQLNFGSLETQRLSDIRSKIEAHASALGSCLQTMNVGSNRRMDIEWE